MGEDVARAGFPCGHRLPRGRRAHAVPREARVLARRVRLHHLHRELRSAAGRVAAAVTRATSHVVAVLSGNRNFEGRIHPLVRASYLASPPLVVAYALAGPHGHRPVVRSDRPRPRRRARVPARSLAVAGGGRERPSRHRSPRSSSRREYGRIFEGDERWARSRRRTGPGLRVGSRLHLRARAAVLRGARATSRRRRATSSGPACLVKVGDSITTDHISPAGLDQARLAGRAIPDETRGRATATSTRTARGAATTR